VVAGHALHARDAIVTGGASGIGVETVRALAAAGARVVLAARNEGLAHDVAAALAADTGGKVEAWLLDLASLRSVRAFAERYLRASRPLHILINNAGVMATPQSYTEEGVELQFGTNHLGHFALATALLPALRAAANARVVALSSIGHRRSDIDFDDINFRTRPYDPWIAYGQSKTANALFAVGWSVRYRAEGVTCNAVHPGGIMTGLQKHMTREEQVALGWYDEQGNLNARFKTPEQGAATSVWAAVSPELEGRGGLYLEDCSIAQPWTRESPMSGYLPYARDPERAERLWTASEGLLA
jgi:NAD(P)-dependent dehydrogenase (short-subunit alcohol dehydrogenase family)